MNDTGNNKYYFMHDLQMTSHQTKICLVIIAFIADTFLPCVVNIHQCNCLLCVVSKIIYLLVLLIIVQCIVKIGLVIETFIPNYRLLFFQINSISSIESEEFRETSIVIQTISKKKLKINWNNLSVLLSILLVKHLRIDHY